MSVGFKRGRKPHCEITTFIEKTHIFSMKQSTISLGLICFFIGLFSFYGNAQAPAKGVIDLLPETKWKYTYALHLESNTIIHQAENYYDYYLHFRYDFIYVQYLNGKISKGNWSLKDRELFYTFKNIKKFEVAELSKKKLILEFTQPNAKGTYQYHFIRVETHETPFINPANQLPEVNVEAVDLRPREEKKKWWVFNKKKRKKKRRKDKAASNDPYINVELIGGGYYGGINPVLRDFIHIKSDGRLVKEFKSVENGLIVTKKNIPRAELESFVEWVKKEGYFEFDRMYDCSTVACSNRKRQKPTPIPLRLAITLGTKRKVVTISIWGEDETKAQYVDYPPVLNDIIDMVQKFAHRAESKVVGR